MTHALYDSVMITVIAILEAYDLYVHLQAKKRQQMKRKVTLLLKKLGVNYGKAS
jgi:hypothetical protein